jgi:hypothetical protein
MNFDELVRLGEECKELSLVQKDFVTCRQFDELARGYRRLAAQVRRLEGRLRRVPSLAA